MKRSDTLPLSVERWTLDVERFCWGGDERPTLNVQRSTSNLEA